MTVWHIVRRQTEWNLTNWRYHLTHCQMTGWVEPDKLKILFHTLSDDSLTHCQATDEWTGQTEDIIWHTVRWQAGVNLTSRWYQLTHHQMTEQGECGKRWQCCFSQDGRQGRERVGFADHQKLVGLRDVALDLILGKQNWPWEHHYKWKCYSL